MLLMRVPWQEVSVDKNTEKELEDLPKEDEDFEE